MSKLIYLIVALALVACTTDDQSSNQDAPPFGDNERIGGGGDGKADGGSAVRVKARTSGYRSADNTNCYDTNYEFDVSYENHSLPWGTNVEVVSAMKGYEWWPDDVNNTYHYDYYDWKYEEWKGAQATAAWTWSALRSTANFWGGGVFENMHFVLRITYPDGTVKWDNGGSAWGYYRLGLMSAPCDPSWTPWVDTTPMFWKDMPVQVIQKW
jgi:hypothetical protein